MHIICSCTTFPTSERQLFKDVLAEFKDGTNCIDYLNKNIMHLVCENSGCYIPMIDRVKYIMEQFPDFNLNMADIAGETPLHKACTIDNRDLINYLCEKGGDANATSNVCCFVLPVHLNIVHQRESQLTAPLFFFFVYSFVEYNRMAKHH